MKHNDHNLPPQTILDHLAVGVFAVDAQFHITAFNSKVEELTGYSRQDAVGRLCYEIFRADKCFEGLCPLRRSMEQDMSLLRERATILCKNNQERPVEVTAAVIRNAQGQVVGGVETILDDSDRLALEKKIQGSYQMNDLVGRSPMMLNLFESLPVLAASDLGILVLGETGTGKGLVARTLHNASPRKNAPFIKVNCAALPASLLESELFGYRKGAFTDAHKDKPGMFELAHQGTLFLDEIGEMSLEVQAKVLQAIEDKEFFPLGGTMPATVDVRIIASTNRNLLELVQQGLFRADLYYRLQVAQIELPPLRERTEDIPLLIDYFFHELKAKTLHQNLKLDRSALRLLLGHAFPGNVRELYNILEYAVIIQQNQRITVQDLPRYLHFQTSRPADPGQVRTLNPSQPASPDLTPAKPVKTGQELTRELLQKTLARTLGNRGRAARLLGISRTTLWRRMKDHGLL